MREGEQKFRVSVSVVGVKRRCRKTERHTLKIGVIDYDADISQERIDELMATAKGLIDANMKEAQKAQLDLIKVTIGEYFESFELFDPKHKSFKIDVNSKLERVLA